MMFSSSMLKALANNLITSRTSSYFRYLSSLVLAEHEGGSVKAQTLSAIEAAKSLGEDNSVSVLLAGSGPSLQQAATHATSCHPSVSQVLVADSEHFQYPLAEPWARLVQLVQLKSYYSHIIATAGSFGKNILPCAAALLDVSPITDVVKISESRLSIT
jgi:electron transfer flavoprotein alpha subunit